MTSKRTIDRVQDTARWVAMARALESERADALFDDPHARRLAGATGEEIVREMSRSTRGTWPIVARTYIIDRLVTEVVRADVDAVLNLAAGLDCRPYRLALPDALTWIEVDHEDVIEAKTDALRTEVARCQLERVSLDLSDADGRRALFAGVSARFPRVLVLTEGLLYYLSEEAALELARDLRALAPVRWITDLHNAAVIRFVAKRSRDALQGTARMQFAPDEGPQVFAPLGWRTVTTTSVFKMAGQLKRLPFPMSLFARLPERPYGTPGRPWTGVCVLEPAPSARDLAG